MNLGITSLMSSNLGAITYNCNLLILLDLAVYLDNDCLQYEEPLLSTASSLSSADISTRLQLRLLAHIQMLPDPVGDYAAGIAK